jgi:hypothetical protein
MSVSFQNIQTGSNVLTLVQDVRFTKRMVFTRCCRLPDGIASSERSGPV